MIKSTTRPGWPNQSAPHLASALGPLVRAQPPSDADHHPSSQPVVQGSFPAHTHTRPMHNPRHYPLVLVPPSISDRAPYSHRFFSTRIYMLDNYSYLCATDAATPSSTHHQDATLAPKTRRATCHMWPPRPPVSVSQDNASKQWIRHNARLFFFISHACFTLGS